MFVKVFGANQKTASISVRERLSSLSETAANMKFDSGLELVVLNTCNRAEIYISGTEKAAREAFDGLIDEAGVEPEDMQFFYEYDGMEAAKHLFQVAAGLDSMVIGETQILHQIKSSYNRFVELGTVGKSLHALFQKALEIGKSVRRRTSISDSKVSVASIAIETAGEFFGSLKEKKALIIGAGEVAKLVAGHLAEKTAGSICFVNRTEEKAARLAEIYSCRYGNLADLKLLAADCDIIVGTTSAPTFVVAKNMLEEAMMKRPERPLLFLDMAVPRDADPEIADIINVYLYDIDNLQVISANNLMKRQTEAEKVEAIIEEELKEFSDRIRRLAVVPYIRRLRKDAKEKCSEELRSFFTENPELSEASKESVSRQSRLILGKWLHNKICKIKSGMAYDPQSTSELSGELLGLSPLAVSKLLGRQPRNDKKPREMA